MKFIIERPVNYDSLNNLDLRSDFENEEDEYVITNGNVSGMIGYNSIFNPYQTSLVVAIGDSIFAAKIADDKLVEIVRENFDLRPAGIIKMLDLRRPIYKQTAAYGHFGRNDLDLPWEKLDKVDTLKKYL